MYDFELNRAYLCRPPLCCGPTLATISAHIYNELKHGDYNRSKFPTIVKYQHHIPGSPSDLIAGIRNWEFRTMGLGGRASRTQLNCFNTKYLYSLSLAASYFGSCVLLTRQRATHFQFESVSHRNGFRAEYSGRNLTEYSADTVSVKIMGFGDERNIG